MKKKRTHNYPKTRRPRCTQYANTVQLIQKHGVEKIREVGTDMGMYRAAAFFSTKELPITPYMIRHLVYRFSGKRPAERAKIIFAGVKAGSMPASHYKSLQFSIQTKQTEE